MEAREGYQIGSFGNADYFQALNNAKSENSQLSKYLKNNAEAAKAIADQQRRLKDQQEAEYYMSHPWELVTHPDKLGLVVNSLGQTFDYLKNHPDEAVRLGLDAVFSISSIENILSGKAGLMDYVDVLLTYGGIIFSAGAAVVAKLGLAAMKIAKVAMVVEKAGKAVSVLSKTEHVVAALDKVEHVGKVVVSTLDKGKSVLKAVEETKAMRGVTHVVEALKDTSGAKVITKVTDSVKSVRETVDAAKAAVKIKALEQTSSVLEKVSAKSEAMANVLERAQVTMRQPALAGNVMAMSRIPESPAVRGLKNISETTGKVSKNLEKLSKDISKSSEVSHNLITGNNVTVDTNKFTNYIFRDGVAPGKDTVFKNLGYQSDNSQSLSKIFHEQQFLNIPLETIL